MNIELKNVTKAYGSRVVWQELSLTLPLGEITCLMAPSGRGKTTLLRLLLGLEPPTSGEITGVPERCSAVFQEPRLFPDISLRKNVLRVLPRGREGEALALLERLGLGEALDTPARQLSGGMARRTALARALLADYDLLVLDEPFQGLDEDNRRRAAGLIREYAAGKTVLLVTHDEADASILNARIQLLP